MPDNNDNPEITIDVDFDVIVDTPVEGLEYTSDINEDFENIGCDVVISDSVRAYATEVEGGVEITIEDFTGTTSGVVRDGYTPVKGTDYFTDAEINAIVDDASAIARATYVHSQMSASDVWDITHNLNKRPGVTVIDSGDSVVMGDITYINDNRLVITFSAPFSGKAYLN